MLTKRWCNVSHFRNEFYCYVGLLRHFILFAAEVIRSFSYQCQNDEEIAEMWEACKISIGKRCQNLRKNDNSHLG